jgi:outer membrane protein assembly factor BamB
MARSWEGNPFVRGIITPPIAADGKVLVAVPNQHRIVALDAKTGRSKWEYVAGGRIDTPPSIYDGRCLFGSHDGWVYCLDAENGELAWRFRAAPVEARIMAYGQMESPWPVPGSILIDEGVAYFPAGRHPKADGGVYVYALDARTGKVKWAKVVNELALKGWYAPRLPGGKGKLGVDFEPVDMLVKDGNCVAMSRWRFDPKTGDFKLELGSTTYDAGGQRVPRGIWGYGIRQKKKLVNKPPAVFGGGSIHIGKRGDVALLVAGGVLAVANQGKLKVGETLIELPSPPLHDGLIVAYGSVYASTRDGAVLCIR